MDQKLETNQNIRGRPEEKKQKKKKKEENKAEKLIPGCLGLVRTITIIKDSSSVQTRIYGPCVRTD